MPVTSAPNNSADSNVQALSYLFKGLIVAASPIAGWAVLKCILLIFSSPKYFFFTWLVILGIGLLAEFFTDAWRPSVRLSRTATVNTNGSTVTEEIRQEVKGSKSPTFLFKAASLVEDENGKAPLETKTSAESRQPTSRSSSYDKIKGLGKPVLLRVQELESSPLPQKSKQVSPTAIGKTAKMEELNDNSSSPTSPSTLKENAPAVKDAKGGSKSKEDENENENVDRNIEAQAKLTRTILTGEKGVVPSKPSAKGDVSSTSQRSNGSKEWGLFGDRSSLSGRKDFLFELGVEAMDEEILKYGGIIEIIPGLTDYSSPNEQARARSSKLLQ